MVLETEYEANRIYCPPPLFVPLKVLVDIGVFVYYYIAMKPDLNYLVPLNSFLIYNPERKRELWRFFTYSILHGGLTNIN